MKTRKQVIEEILAQRRQHSAEELPSLEYTLNRMQDAHVFSLAQDLNISLETEAVVS